MIRKTLIASLIIIVVVVLALPLVFSFQLDKYQSAYVARLSRQSWLRVENVQFSRGWFSSRSSFTLVPDGLMCSDDCPHIQVNSTIYHGPLPFEAFSKAGVPAQFALGVVQSNVRLTHVPGNIKPPLPPLKVTTLIHLDGSQSANMKMPASTHHVTTSQGNYDLKVDALQGSARLNHNSRLEQASMETPGFILKDANDQAVVMQAGNARLKVEQADDGTLHVMQNLDSLRVHGAGGASFDLKGLQIGSHSRRKQGLSSGTLSVSFKTLATGAHTYGPAAMHLHAQRINARALHRLDSGFAQLASNHLSPALSMIGALAVYQNNAAALLRPGPKVDIQQASLVTPKGRLSGSLDVEVPPSKRASAPGLTTLIDTLKMTGQAQIPKPVMQSLMRHRLAFEQKETPGPDQVNQALKNLVSRGVLKPTADGNAYDFRAQLQQGQFTINGQPSTAWKKLHALIEQSAKENPLRYLQQQQQQQQQQQKSTGSP